jgi:hypothetical protein
LLVAKFELLQAPVSRANKNKLIKYFAVSIFHS